MIVLGPICWTYVVVPDRLATTIALVKSEVLLHGWMLKVNLLGLAKGAFGRVSSWVSGVGLCRIQRHLTNGWPL